jgi:phosphatidylglycerophosphate synthase
VTIRLRTDRQLAAAVGAQVMVLAGLSAGAGLGPVGWLAGAAYTAGLQVLLASAARRSGTGTLGPADLVTLARAVLIGGVTALVADQLWGVGGSTWALVLLAAVALALDAVDGRVARRSGTTSALGARFDMEVDSFLVLVLSVHVAVLLGPWVLVIGGMRYAFVAASRALPWLRSELPPRYSAKVVAALQGIVLVLAASDVLPRPLVAALVAAALAALVWSFGRDVLWLRRHADRPATAGGPDRTPADGGAGGRPGRHRVATWLTSAVAVVLLLVALVAPDEVTALTFGAFVRIPAEGLLGIALLLVLPWRQGRVVATLAGVALGLLTVLKVLDLGFSAVLARPFDPLTDWSAFARAVEFLGGSSGRVAAVAAVVAAVVLTAAVIILMTWSVLRLARLVHRRRTAAARSVLVLGTMWITCAVIGAQLVPHVPVAAASAATLVHDRTVQVRADLRDRQAFAAQVAADAFRGRPAAELLGALRGKDVVVAFVESYGRSALPAPQVGAVLEDGRQRLAAAGFSARSAFLTSPTTGAYSWLGHSTFLSGTWVDSQQRYRDLVSGDRLTLTRTFRDAGWRTVAVMPGTTRAWPEADFYGLDEVLAADDLGYRGPDHGWPTIPDQYTLAAFERREHGRADRPPLMGEVVLASSHTPWQFVPPVIGWDEVGDGSAFAAFPSADAAPDRERYRDAVAYSLACLVSWVETYGDDDLVLVVLGDHQPFPVVTGDGAGADVPVSVVTRDPAVLDRIAGWGWQEGLQPGPRAPVWRMDAFRDRFLTAFSS